jgi:hypothetical protein
LRCAPPGPHFRDADGPPARPLPRRAVRTESEPELQKVKDGVRASRAYFSGALKHQSRRKRNTPSGDRVLNKALTTPYVVVAGCSTPQNESACGSLSAGGHLQLEGVARQRHLQHPGAQRSTRGSTAHSLDAAQQQQQQHRRDRRGGSDGDV